MFGFGKKKEPQRWGGKYAIKKTTRNNGDVYWQAVRRKSDYAGGEYWVFISDHGNCKSAEAWLDDIWAEDIAKTEILTSCEECE